MSNYLACALNINQLQLDQMIFSDLLNRIFITVNNKSKDQNKLTK